MRVSLHGLHRASPHATSRLYKISVHLMGGHLLRFGLFGFVKDHVVSKNNFREQYFWKSTYGGFSFTGQKDTEMDTKFESVDHIASPRASLESEGSLRSAPSVTRVSRTA